MKEMQTLEEVKEAYVRYAADLHRDGHESNPVTFLTVMFEWELPDELGYRLRDMTLMRQFLWYLGYDNNEIEQYLGDIAGEEYHVNVEASIAQGEVDHTICLFYDEAIDIEIALASLRNELIAAKNARDKFFAKYPGRTILR